MQITRKIVTTLMFKYGFFFSGLPKVLDVKGTVDAGFRTPVYKEQAI